MIIGAGRLGQDIARRLARTPWSGLFVRGFYDDDPALAGNRVEGVDVRGPVDALASHLAAQTVDQVWIALPLRAEARIRELLLQLRQHSVEVRLVPDIFNFTLLNHSMTEVAGLAGDQSHRVAALRRQSRDQGRRGFRAVARCSSSSRRPRCC